MSFKNEIGSDVNVPGELRADKKIFGETGGFVIEVAIKNIKDIKNIFAQRNVELIGIGETTAEKKIKMNGCIELDLAETKQAWTNGLRNRL